MTALTHDEALAVLRRAPAPRAGLREAWPLLLGAWCVLMGTARIVRGMVAPWTLAVVVLGVIVVWWHLRARAQAQRAPLPVDADTRLHRVRYEQQVPTGKRLLVDALGQAWFAEGIPASVQVGDLLWATPIRDGEPCVLVPLSGSGTIRVERCHRWVDDTHP